MARCVRCHNSAGENGAGQVDPLSAKTGLSKLNEAAVPSFDYVYFSDIAASPANTFLKLLPTFVKGSAALSRMPPPPAAALEDWEVQTLENFAKTLP